MSHQWHFPQTNAGQIQEINSALENFKKSGKTAAIREIIQNSLDAQLDEEKPSHVTFEFESFSKTDFPGGTEFLSYVENLIETKVKVTNKHIDKIPDLFKPLQDTHVLKITDSNTTGVDPITLSEIIIKGVGRSKKGKIDAAGGRGMGKAATMLLSEVQILFYSSKHVDKEKTVHNSFMGLANLESFKFEERTRQSVVYYGDVCDEKTQDGLRAIEDNIPDKFRPKDDGLTIFIIDYSEDEWEDSIIVSAIENFYAAIHDNKLSIAIGKKIINREQLPTLVETYSRDKYRGKYTKHRRRALSFPIKDLYRTYIQTNDNKDDNGKIYHASIMGSKDIELKLIKNEETVKTIHYFNNNGMLIKAEPTTITNASVTITTSGELADFLKTMETTEHTNWFPPQLAVEGPAAVKKGAEVLRDMDTFINETLQKQNEINDDDAMTIDWTADLLPQIDNANNNNSDKEEEELPNIAEPITLKSSTKKSPFDSDREEALVNPDEGNTSGGKSKKKRKTKFGELSEDGKKGYINKKSVLNKKRVMRLNNNHLTIILQSKEEKDCWISVKAIAEDNLAHLLTIENASVDAIACSYNSEKTKIGPIALIKDIATRLTVELTDNYPMALEITSFEFQLPKK